MAVIKFPNLLQPGIFPQEKILPVHLSLERLVPCPGDLDRTHAPPQDLDLLTENWSLPTDDFTLLSSILQLFPSLFVFEMGLEFTLFDGIISEDSVTRF